MTVLAHILVGVGRFVDEGARRREGGADCSPSWSWMLWKCSAPSRLLIERVAQRVAEEDDPR
jgi:hypothetical protein